MELEDVELVGRHLVDDLEQRRPAKEMAGKINQQSTPAEARRIRYVDGRDAPGLRIASEELPEGLDTVEQTARIGGFDQHLAACYAKVITLRTADFADGNQRKSDARSAMAAAVQSQRTLQIGRRRCRLAARLHDGVGADRNI